jgi:hypothetical protein
MCSLLFRYVEMSCGIVSCLHGSNLMAMDQISTANGSSNGTSNVPNTSQNVFDTVQIRHLSSPIRSHSI